MERKIRVIIAKAGLDGHDRGAKVIAAAFRDSGIEVIYLGLRQTPEMIVEAALQEDADAIGISILSGAHMTVFKKILEVMKTKNLDNVLLFGGGIIPKEDISKLKKLGVGELFTPGTPTTDTVEYVKKWVNEHRTLEV
ncbi:MAG: cobalamin B12-binding domain-containing protein [Ignavibacteria bacterium]|nr:cobalamin B12-binding domain-containing protein [Ignavibacteria bacterium]